MIDPDSTSGFHPDNSTGITNDCLEIEEHKNDPEKFKCPNCGAVYDWIQYDTCPVCDY